MTTPAAGGDTRGGTGRTGGGAGGGVGAAGTGYVTQPRTGRQRTFYPPRSSRRPGGPSRMLPTMTPTRPDGPAVAEPTLRAVLADAAGWYRGQLLAGAEPAVGLLRGRGLIDLAVDTPAGLRWRFGYAPDGGHHLLTHLRGLGHPDALTVAAGLAAQTESRGLVDVLRDRLVVPLRDEAGVVGFAGRRLSEPLADATWVPPKWLNTATTALYRKSLHLYGLAEQPTSSRGPRPGRPRRRPTGRGRGVPRRARRARRRRDRPHRRPRRPPAGGQGRGGRCTWPTTGTPPGRPPPSAPR